MVVINSLANGAAGASMRKRTHPGKKAVSACKSDGNEISVCEPIGGAKSGTDFDPNHPKRLEVLQRWYQAVLPLLKLLRYRWPTESEMK